MTDAGNSNGVLLYSVNDELLNNLRTFKYYYTNFMCQGHEHKTIIQQVWILSQTVTRHCHYGNYNCSCCLPLQFSPPGCVDVLGQKPPTLSVYSEIKSRSCHHRVIQTGRIRYKWKTGADYRLQQDADRATWAPAKSVATKQQSSPFPGHMHCPTQQLLLPYEVVSVLKTTRTECDAVCFRQ